MFLVGDKITERHLIIGTFLCGEHPSVAILLAAADFERTTRRAILALGTSPTKAIKATVFGNKFHGLKRFKEAWRDEVRPNVGVDLAESVVTEWEAFGKAFEQRHRLIHGATGRISVESATESALRILRASRQVHDFSAKPPGWDERGLRGFDLDGVIRRYKRRVL